MWVWKTRSLATGYVNGNVTQSSVSNLYMKTIPQLNQFTAYLIDRHSGINQVYFYPFNNEEDNKVTSFKAMTYKQSDIESDKPHILVICGDYRW